MHPGSTMRGCWSVRVDLRRRRRLSAISPLFGEDRKLLQGWLAKTYGHLLTPEEQKNALSFRCSGWGRLSGIFLTKIFHMDAETEEACSILDMLWQTNDNLMELLSNRYTFARAVEEYRREKLVGQGLTLQDYLDESYASSAIKRSIHQVIGIVGEIAGIMKCPPKRIFWRWHGKREKREDGPHPAKRNYWSCIKSAGKTPGLFSSSCLMSRTEISAGTSYISTTPSWADVCTAGSLYRI